MLKGLEVSLCGVDVPIHWHYPYLQKAEWFNTVGTVVASQRRRVARQRSKARCAWKKFEVVTNSIYTDDKHLVISKCLLAEHTDALV